MHTCCNVNSDMENEYLHEAREIAELLSSGINPRQAVIQVFDKWFDEKGYMEGGREPYLIEIVQNLEAGAK